MVVLTALALALQGNNASFRDAGDIGAALKKAEYKVDLHETPSGPFAILEKGGVKALMTFASPGGMPLSVEITTRYLMPESYRPGEVERWYEARKLYGFQIHPRITDTVSFTGQVMLNSGPPAEKLITALDSFCTLNQEFGRRFGSPNVLDPRVRPIGKRPSDSLVIESLDLEEIASLIVFWHWDRFPAKPPGNRLGGPMAAGSAYIDGVYANLTPVYGQPGVVDISYWILTERRSSDPPKGNEGPFTDIRRALDGVSAKAVVSVKGVTCAKLRQDVLRLAHRFAAMAKSG